MEKTYYICTSYKEFDRYRRRDGCSREQAVYVQDGQASQLITPRTLNIRCVGNYYEREDWQTVCAILETRNKHKHGKARTTTGELLTA